MRVTLVTGKYPPEPCGIGDHVRRLAVELAKEGHDVSVLTSSGRSGEPGFDRQEDAEIIRTVSGWDFGGYGKILRHLRKYRTEVVHIHYQPDLYGRHPMITLLPILLNKWSLGYRAKTIVTLHELTGPRLPPFFGPLRRAWVLLLAWSSYAAIVTNERDLSLLRRVPWLRKKLRYIPFGANIEADDLRVIDKQTIRRELGATEEEVLVARFGFVHDIRANLFPELIRAIERLSKKGFRVRLLLVGGENRKDREKIESLAGSIGIGNLIVFTGFCSPGRVLRYLAASDIGVQLYPEGACEKRTGLLTALACGLPVVGLGRRHVASMFTHRDNIMLAFSALPDDIAEAIEGLILDKELRIKLSAGAVRLAAGFNWKSIGTAIGRLYGTEVQGPRTRA